MTFGPTTVTAEALADTLRRGQERARAFNRPVLVSVAQPAPFGKIPLRVFTAARRPGVRRTFWAQPSEDLWMVGVGSAAAVAVDGPQPLDKLRKAHQSLLEGAVVQAPERRGVGPVVLGSMRFDPQATRSPLWKDFPDGLLVLPRLLFTTSGGEQWLTTNVMAHGESDPEAEAATAAAELERLEAADPALMDQPSFCHEQQDATADWMAGVRRVLQAIEEGRVTKVVLARRTTLRSERDFRVEGALDRLMRAYPECSTFAVDVGGPCFMGASPEVLVRLEGGVASVSCLAGSIARGTTPQEDEALARQLLSSAKDRREHAAVVNAVARSLQRLCDDVQRDAEPRGVKLGTVQHLATRFTARPRGPGDILRLVQALHPTPAVGGVPTERALEMIRLREGDRGWYAAPLGWLDHGGEGEFTVAIRSALVCGGQATLFAGSGIVQGSDPHRELEETNLKFQPMLMALEGAVGAV